MLDISTPDAIALGTLILAGLAAWQGSRSGEAAARRTEHGAGDMRWPATDAALREVAEALRGLDATLERMTDASERRDVVDLADMLRRIEATLQHDWP